MSVSNAAKQLKTLWLDDRQAKRFPDVTNDKRLDIHLLFDFFGSREHYEQMKHSEWAHDRPALAGVVREFEELPEVEKFFSGNDSHTTTRLRQAVGVIVRIVMVSLCVKVGWEAKGWETTKKKGSLGKRAKVAPRTTKPGAYRNISGLSQWFISAERYKQL